MEGAEKDTLLSDLKNTPEGDREEVERIRREYFNVLASEAKKSGDLLKLNLLAASDECTRSGLHGAASVISTLLAFYSLGPVRFDILCDLILGPVCTASMEKLSQLMDDVLANEMSSL